MPTKVLQPPQLYREVQRGDASRVVFLTLRFQSSSGLVLRGDAGLMGALAFRPPGLDPFKDVAQFFFGVSISEARHVALISAADHRRRAAHRDIEKDPVGVVPSVACFVVGRRGQPSIGAWRTPVRLALEVGTVARGAGLGIDRFTPRKVRNMDRTGRSARGTAPEPSCSGDPHNSNDPGKVVSGPHSLMPRKRSELPITDTEDRLIAAAAIMGDSRTPKNGNRMPAATGTPAEL